MLIKYSALLHISSLVKSMCFPQFHYENNERSRRTLLVLRLSAQKRNSVTGEHELRASGSGANSVRIAIPGIASIPRIFSRDSGNFSSNFFALFPVRFSARERNFVTKTYEMILGIAKKFLRQSLKFDLGNLFLVTKICFRNGRAISFYRRILHGVR